jgi:hypothetical protein
MPGSFGYKKMSQRRHGKECGSAMQQGKQHGSAVAKQAFPGYAGRPVLRPTLADNTRAKRKKPPRTVAFFVSQQAN